MNVVDDDGDDDGSRTSAIVVVVDGSVSPHSGSQDDASKIRGDDMLLL